MKSRTSFPARDRSQALVAAALLAALVLAVFWPLVGFGFVHWDDDVYVTENTRVQNGVTWDNVRWAFTTTYFGFYYPITWLSHMLDCQLFGLRAGGHHATSILLHLLNALVLFAALRRMTGSVWRSFAVAALFAVHPLSVESVAWVSERKNLLSTFFWFVGLYCYTRYAEKPSKTRYAMVFGSFVLGLMSKSMLVTFPFALLLLDFWPLERWSSTSTAPLPKAASRRRPSASWRRLLLEKLPFMPVALAFGVITYVAQKKIDAVPSLNDITVAQRVANALISYVSYPLKMVAPIHLAAYYQHPRAGVSYALATLCGGALCAVTAAVWLGRRRRYLPVGWLWYLLTLVPVIGLLQVGGQSSADRYTYVPLIGLYILVIWAVSDLLGGPWSRYRKPALIVFALMLVALALRAHAQVYTWRDSQALFTNMVRVSPDAGLAQYNIGIVYDSEDRRDEAIACYRKSIKLDPERGNAWNNLGVDLAKENDQKGALDAFERAEKLLGNNAAVQFNIGRSRETSGDDQKALESYAGALAIDPSHFKACVHSALILERLGRWKDAAAAYAKASQLQPNDPTPLLGLSRMDRKLGRVREAVEVGLKALDLNPDNVQALSDLGLLCEEQGLWTEARAALEKAVALDQTDAENWAYLALARQNLQQTTEAIEAYNEAIRLKPALVVCHFNVGVLYLKQGDRAAAMSQYRVLQGLDSGLAQKLLVLIGAQRETSHAKHP